jgi:hypothetical protein
MHNHKVFIWFNKNQKTLDPNEMFDYYKQKVGKSLRLCE